MIAPGSLPDALETARLRRELARDAAALVPFCIIVAREWPWGLDHVRDVLDALDAADAPTIRETGPRLRRTLEVARELLPCWGHA